MDIRFPVGGIFTIYGVLLIAWGLVSRDLEARHFIGGVQVNIWAGLGMLIFGAAMLCLAWRTPPNVQRALDTPEGRAMEAREKREGLEQ